MVHKTTHINVTIK